METISNRGTLPVGRTPQRIVRSKPSKSLLETEKNTDAVITRDNYLVIAPGVFERASEFVYKNLYIVGVQFKRRRRSYSKKINKFLANLNSSVAINSQKAVQAVGYGGRKFLRRLKSPFINIKDALASGKQAYRKARSEKKGALSSVWTTTKTVAKELWSIFSTALNYVVPVLAFLVITTVISQQLLVKKGLAVSYNNEHIGYIKSESEFSEAVRDVKSRLMENLKDEFVFSVPTYQIVEMSGDMTFVNSESLADNIVGTSSDDIQQAFGLYVDGKLIGAVKEDVSDSVPDELDKILDSNLTGLPGERAKFQKTISFKDGLFPSSSVMDVKDLFDIIYSTEKSELIYTVTAEDTPTSIAYGNNISLEELAKLNPSVFVVDDEGANTVEPADVELKLGQKLYVVRETQFLSVKNIYTEIYNEDIQYEVVENKNYMYAAGYNNIERAGVYGILEITADVTKVDGKEIGRDITKRLVLKEPETELVTVGVERSTIPFDIIDHGTISDSGFAWPGNGGNIGTVLGGYAGHTGVDINNTGGVGSPIFASASGTVTTATFSGYGYGNHVRITHSDDFVSLYAHCTQLYVAVGDYVQTGQIIGTVGTTGNTTGPHLHFEILHNGQIVNPANYIGTSGPVRV